MEAIHSHEGHSSKDEGPVCRQVQTLGYRIQASFLSGYAGHVAPPFERFYSGGENDIRGFDIRSLSPVAYFVEKIDFPAINPDDPCLFSQTVGCKPLPIDENNPRAGIKTVPIPIRRLIFPGGDTNLIANLEYRIPIIGPVTLAPFADFGMNMILRKSQLTVNEQQFQTLLTTSYGCVDYQTCAVHSSGSLHYAEAVILT